MNTVLARRFIQAAICPFGLVLLVSLAWAQQNTIENFDVTQAGGQVLVRVALKNPLAAAPGTFTIANPARIAFDFPDTTNGLGRNSQDIGEAVLRSLNVVQAGGRTPPGLNLRNMVPYRSQPQATTPSTTSAPPRIHQPCTPGVPEVNPIHADANKLVQGTRSGYTGEKLSLNFQNVEVRSVVNVIADFTDLNIITSDTVGGNLTLRLKDVPWDQALDIILQTRGLDMRKNCNVIWI